MFGKRPDGRVIHDAEPMQQIMPYILKTRTDSMNMYEDTFACGPMDAYIREKAAEGIKLSYMHIIIAAIVRLMALRPQLNRFVMNGKIYTRPKIWVSFVVHPTLQDGSVGTTIKLEFEGTETLLEVAEKVTETETTYTMEGDRKISGEYVLGAANSAQVIPNLGTVLSILESKWGFLFFIVFPILIVSVNQIGVVFSNILQVRKEEKQETETKEKDKE